MRNKIYNSKEIQSHQYYRYYLQHLTHLYRLSVYIYFIAPMNSKFSFHDRSHAKSAMLLQLVGWKKKLKDFKDFKSFEVIYGVMHAWFAMGVNLHEPYLRMEYKRRFGIEMPGKMEGYKYSIGSHMSSALNVLMENCVDNLWDEMYSEYLSSPDKFETEKVRFGVVMYYIRLEKNGVSGNPFSRSPRLRVVFPRQTRSFEKRKQSAKRQKTDAFYAAGIASACGEIVVPTALAAAVLA